MEREWLVTSTPSVMHVRAGMRNQHERMPRCAAFLERSTLLHVKHGGFDRLVNVTEQHLTRLRVHLLPAPQSTVSRLFPQTWLEPSVDGGVTQLVTMGRRQSSAMEIPAAATCPVRCKPWGIQSRQRLASCFRGRGGSRARTAMKTLRFGLLGLRVGEELTTDRGVTRPCRDARRFPSIRGVSRCCGRGVEGREGFRGGRSPRSPQRRSRHPPAGCGRGTPPGARSTPAAAATQSAWRGSTCSRSCIGESERRVRDRERESVRDTETERERGT